MSYSPLMKSENPLQYRKLAQQGIMVGHPVSFNGQDKRPDINTRYHLTVKASDQNLTNTSEMHNAALKAHFPHIDPKTTGIEPGVFKDRNGNDVFMIKLHPQDDSLKQANSQFSHIKQFRDFEFTPHVSVDSETWHKIKDSGAKTAHEAGMEFGPAKLFQGDKELAAYHPKKPKVAERSNDNVLPLAASENTDLEPMEKGLKHLATAASMAAAIGMPQNVQPQNHSQDAIKTQSAHPANPASTGYDHQSMLNAISQVESSGGKFVNHRELHGHINENEKAYGSYGITPSIIRETIKMHSDLKQHVKAGNLHGEDMTRYMQDNPELERTIASKHLDRLEHHFGKDPDKIGFAWLSGINGTKKAVNEGKDLGSHWHVKKIRAAYKAPEARYSSN